MIEVNMKLYLFLFLFMVSTIFHVWSKSYPNERPHVIIIVADDLGFNDISFHGSEQIPTPNLDALAYSGIILNSYYVSPICTPSRSSLFSGMHPIHTGMQHDVIFGATPYGFPLSQKLLPQYLKELNYSTHLIGKWHLGHFRKDYTPTCRGFDSFFGYWTAHKDYYENTEQEGHLWGYDMRRNLKTTYDGWGRYSTDVYTEEAVKIINTHAQEHKKNPLFLTITHTAVHSANSYDPLQAPKERIERFSHIKHPQRRTFAAMVSKLDDSVGTVVEALGEKNMLKNSIIIFTTDNGGPAAGVNNNAASNWPLRGVKNTLWEGGVRGAGFIWSPKLKDTARVSNQLMHIQDWLPTLLKAVGANISQILDGKNLDGIDMWDALDDKDKSSPRTQLVHNIDDQYGNEAVRVGDWKLMHGTYYNGNYDGWYGPSGRDMENIFTNDFSTLPAYQYDMMKSSRAGKSIQKLDILPDRVKVENIRKAAEVKCSSTEKNKCNLMSGEFCLFNIVDDPCEYNNLAGERKEILAKLKIELQKYRDSAVPPRNQPPDSRAYPNHWNYTWTNWFDFIEPGPSLCRDM